MAACDAITRRRSMRLLVGIEMSCSWGALTSRYIRFLGRCAPVFQALDQRMGMGPGRIDPQEHNRHHQCLQDRIHAGMNRDAPYACSRMSRACARASSLATMIWPPSPRPTI